MSKEQAASFRYFVQHSPSVIARVLRGLYRSARDFSVPSPSIIVKPILKMYIFIRNIYYFFLRVFICEPLFKAYCASHGRNLHTGSFLHWVQGAGRIVVGDNVTIDGKCSFIFTTAYVPAPLLKIGSNVVIGHNSSFTIGREIRIGSGVMIAGNCSFLDTNGHSVDPVHRLKKLPAPPEKVRAIRIADRAWIGQGSIILPGSSIGEATVIAAHSVVRGTIPAFEIWGGNPASKIASLQPPDVPKTPEPEAPKTESQGSPQVNS